MSFGSKSIYRGFPPVSSELVQLTQPIETGNKLIIKHIMLVNTNTAVGSTVNLSVGATVGSAVPILSSMVYDLSEHDNIGDLFIVLESGDILFANQTVANAVCLCISGVNEGTN